MVHLVEPNTPYTVPVEDGMVELPPLYLRQSALEAHEHLAEYQKTEDPTSLTNACTRVLRDVEFREVLKSIGITRISSLQQVQQVLQAYLHWLLNAKRDYESAASLIWGPETFDPRPRSVRLVWHAIRTGSLTNIMGGASQGKTYSASAYFLLDWLADPQQTRIQVMSTREDHLIKNLFADFQRMYRGSMLPLPGTAESKSITFNEQAKKEGFGIFVLVAQHSPNAGGVIKGAKVKPRHPWLPSVISDSTRLRLLIDEAQEVPPSIFNEIPNLYSSMRKGDPESIKIVMAANPSDEHSNYGRNCEPAGGWATVKDNPYIEMWEGKTGWLVCRLNAARSENVLSRKEVYPRLLSYEGYLRIIRQEGSDNAPGVWTQIYGMFPPQGAKAQIISGPVLEGAKGEWIFESIPTEMAACDPAFTGDNPTLATGRHGWASHWRTDDGVTIKVARQYAIQVDRVSVLRHGDTQEIADQVMSICRERGITPDQLAVDHTGTGRGVGDIISSQWYHKVDRVSLNSARAMERAPIVLLNYSEKATDTKVVEEDIKTCYEMYDGLVTELWYAAAQLMRYGVVKVGRMIDPETMSELLGRKGQPAAGKNDKVRVESKAAHKAKGAKSPDRGDSVTMLIHVARTTEGVRPKLPETAAPTEARGWDTIGSIWGNSDAWGSTKGVDIFDGIDFQRD